jgi:UDP:flavonoid glycosyltransferase YjiC (YdhE family)
VTDARVLFTTTPGRGHYHPMLALAGALAERGHEIAWAAAEPVCVRLRELGYTAMASGNPEPPAGLSLLDRYPEVASVPPAERPDLLFAKIFGPERAGPMLEDLLPLAREWSPSVMVCEQAELAGPIVAAALGVPNVTTGFGHPLPAVRVARAADAMQPLWEERGLTARPFAGTYEHLYVDIYPEALKAYGNEHIRDVFKLRPHDPPPVAPTAALPLVYVTFGTVFNRDLNLIATVVEGVRDLPVEVVVTLGPGNDPAALGEQPPNVQVAEYIPQADLLPRCAAVVSHGGSGTFLAALAQGLPQLVLPQAADQFLNASAGARAGVAREIPAGEITSERVREELEGVLGDPALAAAARAMSAEIAAMPSAGDVADELGRRYGRVWVSSELQSRTR